MSEAVPFMKGIIRKFANSEYVLMVCMAAVVGVLGGYGPRGSGGPSGFSRTCFSRIRDRAAFWMRSRSPLVCQADSPMTGGAVVGLMVCFFAHEAKGRGAPQVTAAQLKRDSIYTLNGEALISGQAKMRVKGYRADPGRRPVCCR